jgi:hypothetical protein
MSGCILTRRCTAGRRTTTTFGSLGVTCSLRSPTSSLPMGASVVNWWPLCRQFGCAGADVPSLKITVGSVGLVEFTVCGASDPCWPRGVINPYIISALRERSGGNRPDIDYEKSGQQPSPTIKRVLKRTARDCVDASLEVQT